MKSGRSIDHDASHWKTKVAWVDWTKEMYLDWEILLQVARNTHKSCSTLPWMRNAFSSYDLVDSSPGVASVCNEA